MNIPGISPKSAPQPSQEDMLRALVARSAGSGSTGGSADFTALNSALDRLLELAVANKNSVTVRTAGNEALTRLFTGQKMYVDVRDNSVAPHLMLEGRWEDEITKVFLSIVGPGDTVLDLGANFGYFGIIAGSVLDHDKANLRLIEANPVFEPLITKSLAVNGLAGIGKVSNIAIGDKQGTATLQRLHDDWASATAQTLEEFDKRREVAYEVEDTIEVPMLTLDQYCEQESIDKVDVIKIDIEGFEERAYPGMKNIIAASPDLRMLLEFSINGYKNSQAFFEQLKNDFEFIYGIKEGDSALMPIDSYEDLKQQSHHNWLMLLLSKHQVA